MPGFFDKQLVIAKAEILRAIDQLDVREAFRLFVVHGLDFNIVLAGRYTTAAHRLLDYGAFDYFRGFLRLVGSKGKDVEALKAVLIGYRSGEKDLRLADHALGALFDEIKASKKSGGIRDPEKIKWLAGVAHFVIKFTGELPGRLPAFKKCPPEKKAWWLDYCANAYVESFPPRQRRGWEAEFGVVLRVEASPHLCALAR